VSQHFSVLWHDQICKSELDPTARHVGLALCWFMDRTGQCYPSRPTLAERTGYSVRTVERALKRLEQAGDLRVQRGGGRGKTNLYVGVLKGDRGDAFSELKGRQNEPKRASEKVINGDTAVSTELIELKRELGPVETEEERRQRVAELRAQVPHLLRSVPE
jgi:DNA-binding transcriptional MocR family regulator